MRSRYALGVRLAQYCSRHESPGHLPGGFALQQFGTVEAGEHTLHHEVVPGSGRDGLAGITGVMHLPIDEDGTHRYLLDYSLQPEDLTRRSQCTLAVT